MNVGPSVAFVSTVFHLVFLGECPIAAASTVDDAVVDTTGLVATPPVGEVEHDVNYGTKMRELGLVAAIDHRLVKLDAKSCVGGSQGLGLEPVDTGTKADDGREPLADIEAGGRREAVAGIAVDGFRAEEVAYAALVVCATALLAQRRVNSKVKNVIFFIDKL